MFTQQSTSNFSSELKSFFIKEESTLTLSYPGISLRRLSEELNQLKILDYFEFKQWLEHLRQGIPLEYISKKAYFYKSEFFVDQTVLIPRSETEIIVEMACEYLSSLKKISSVLDLGCGSGSIALSIMQDVDTPHSFTLSDISEDALEIAKLNAWELKYRYNPEHTIEYVLSDRYSVIDKSFDLIVSNPPYIKSCSDLSGVHCNVDKFEPSIALFVDDDIYDSWFYLLFKETYSHLKTNGLFLMEGHEEHLKNQSLLLKDIGFESVEVINDLTNRPRFLKAVKG